MGLLGVAEAAIHEPQDAGHDQHECGNLDRIPVVVADTI